jgi:hypothetical protein
MEKMTEAQMIEELKTWDEEDWKRFKQTQYEVIALIPESLEDE